MAKVLRIIVEKGTCHICGKKILLALMDSSLKLQLLSSCKHFLEVSLFEVNFPSFFNSFFF